jgi:hypothetical protein
LGEPGDDEGQLDLGQGEADAGAGPPPEGHPRLVGDRLLFGREVDEALGVEAEGVGPGARVAACEVYMGKN